MLDNSSSPVKRSFEFVLDAQFESEHQESEEDECDDSPQALEELQAEFQQLPENIDPLPPTEPRKRFINDGIFDLVESFVSIH